jgi:glucosylglycerate phosphorylase
VDSRDYEVLRPYLEDLYGPEAGQAACQRLSERLERFHQRGQRLHPADLEESSPADRLDEGDSLLITYPDQFQEPGVKPLVSLAKFAESRLAGVVSGMHILPFFPWSSDDGFAVIDYQSVDPALGDWPEIRRLSSRFRLMVDAVVNHTSTKCIWFQKFLQGDPVYRDYYIVAPPGTDLSQVVRPRALPLLTPFDTVRGKQWVWTTFSADQVDLNYHHPEVLLDVIEALLTYIDNGARLIRLDAIAYLWKEIGTPCIHLPQTHEVIRLLRKMLDLVAPQVALVTETNVPQRENLSYFGNGRDEAQLVYNFPLPPLTMHAFLAGTARYLTDWAGTLALPSKQTTFLNFLASHDGIGLNPARGILAPGEIDRLVQATEQRGGLVSSKTDPDGGESPYELNISYFDALSDPHADEPPARQVERFMAAQAILLALVGVPGIYVHSLLGSRSWREGVELTGRKRTINRQKFTLAEVERELNEPGSLRAQVFQGYRRLLKARAGAPAFDPYGEQQVLEVGEAVFGLLRLPREEGRPVICLHNVSEQRQVVQLEMKKLGLVQKLYRDLIGGEIIESNQDGRVELGPYQVLWLV